MELKKIILNIYENNKDNSSSNSKYKSLYNNNIIFIDNLIKSLQNKFLNNSSNEISEIFTIKATVLEFEHGSQNYYYGCPNKICRKKFKKKIMIIFVQDEIY